MKGQTIAEVRAFNRFYTDILGLLERNVVHSNYCLAEGRIMYEIYTAGSIQASQIMSAMHIDKSYLSRLLKKLEGEHLITRTASETDGRAVMISLTAKGIKEFAYLNEASDLQIDQLVKGLTAGEQQELVFHLQSVITLISPYATENQ